jgi:hypothetical protein
MPLEGFFAVPVPSRWKRRNRKFEATLLVCVSSGLLIIGFCFVLRLVRMDGSCIWGRLLQRDKWARQGRLKAYALAGAQRRVCRFLRSDLDAIVMHQETCVKLGPTVRAR